MSDDQSTNIVIVNTQQVFASAVRDWRDYVEELPSQVLAEDRP